MIAIGNILMMADGPLGEIKRFVEYKPGKYIAALERGEKFFPVYFEVPDKECGLVEEVEPDFSYFADPYKAIAFALKQV